MVRGRLLRESNPIPKQPAGFRPQHDSSGNEDYVNTSPLNPLPSGNYIQNEAGVWVPVSLDNPVPTQLTGSIVEDETFFERAIRTESTNSSSSFDVKTPNGAKGAFITLVVH